jgi:hypothetical protein
MDKKIFVFFYVKAFIYKGEKKVKGRSEKNGCFFI